MVGDMHSPYQQWMIAGTLGELLRTPAFNAGALPHYLDGLQVIKSIFTLMVYCAMKVWTYVTYTRTLFTYKHIRIQHRTLATVKILKYYHC